MHIGIIEICVSTHYLGVQTLALTYLSDPGNSVIVFTTKDIEKILQYTNSNSQMEIITIQDQESIENFLKRINSYKIDRLHFNTVSMYFKQINKIKWEIPLYISIHNTEEWVENTMYDRTNFLIYSIANRLYKKNGPTFLSSTKRYIRETYYNYYRQLLLKQVYQNNGKFIVYSQAQHKHLAKFIDYNNIIIFPFAHFNETVDLSTTNSRIRICVVGVVSKIRRDYDTLLNLLEENPTWKQKLTIDILGYVSPDSYKLITRFDKLISEGYEILYYKNFVPDNKLDIEMSKADIILVNVHVIINSKQRYGQTKESGAISNMIKSAKPGLLHIDYSVDENIKRSCIYYKNKNDLKEQINFLIDNTNKLQKLKSNALILSKEYRPKNLYTRLIDSKI